MTTFDVTGLRSDRTASTIRRGEDPTVTPKTPWLQVHPLSTSRPPLGLAAGPAVKGG